MAFQIYHAVENYGWGDITSFGYFDSEEKAQAAIDAEIAELRKEWADSVEGEGYVQKHIDRMTIWNITVN